MIPNSCAASIPLILITKKKTQQEKKPQKLQTNVPCKYRYENTQQNTSKIQSKCSPVDEWMNQIWHNHTMDCWFSAKESTCQCRRHRLDFWFGKIPWRRSRGNPLQYSCMKNLMDRGAWWATVYWVAKSRTPPRMDYTQPLKGMKQLTCYNMAEP